ncbi:YcdB/YcdC domain-containing protein [Lysinibacillus sp. NPDC096418]|uniref:YcdB/YcdC domain-containing protein n=1 Tax=Lysinibacillus sp. NPDC096418 TaxID=3364138 RepID=UPI00381E0EC9
MLKAKMRQHALSFIQLPNHFKPFLEEYFEGENGEGEVMFSWTDEAQDEGITIKLDYSGNLTSLSINIKEYNSEIVPLNFEEKRERVERFLLSHYPDALKNFTFYSIKKLTRTERFYYEQVVMDLPLGNAGCYIDINSLGTIVGFTYYGVKPIPNIPSTLISKIALREHVQNSLNLKLEITNFCTSTYNVKEDGFRLVYGIDSLFQYKADTLQPTLTIIHDEHEPERYISLPAFSNKLEFNGLSNEEIIGIMDEMEIIREVDMGEEMGIVWRDPDWKMDEKDISMDGFFKRQTEDTVKAFISKKTAKVRSFMWFKERNGNLQLSREACYQKAITFLQNAVPEYYQYLQLIVVEHEEEDDTSLKEVFRFHMHNGQNIPIHNFVVVNVNRTTGLIDNFSGPSFDVEELKRLPVKPTISKKDASEMFFNQVDFELAWNRNYDDETESYTLVYRACDRQTRKPIRYIDGITGVAISYKE